MSLSGALQRDVEGLGAPKPAVGGRWRKRTLITLCALVAAAPLFLVVWNNGLRRMFIPKKFGVVEPGRIYRSGQISGSLLGPTLARNHIGLIIDLSIENTPDAQAERALAVERHIPRLNLSLRGNGVGNPDVYVQALTAIIEADRRHTPVLVHCQAGTERTGGVIAAYRILVEGKSEEDAFAEARGYGHSDRENPHLIPFVKEHLEEWRSELVRRRLIGGS